ncbi:MAG: hypothetical protein WCG25_05545 [bacterium]
MLCSFIFADNLAISLLVPELSLSNQSKISHCLLAAINCTKVCSSANIVTS